MAYGTHRARANWQSSDVGYGIHWPGLDESTGVEGLLLGRKSSESPKSFEQWLPLVQETDTLLVGGGDPLYLCYWMQQSGLDELLPSLRAVYVGLSAGSMVMTPRIGEHFVGWTPPDGGDETLGLVDFSIFPHLDHEMLPYNTLTHAERWAADLVTHSYAIDDQTAIKVTDGTAEVISEGRWQSFTP